MEDQETLIAHRVQTVTGREPRTPYRLTRDRARSWAAARVFPDQARFELCERRRRNVSKLYHLTYEIFQATSSMVVERSPLQMITLRVIHTAISWGFDGAPP